MGNIILMRFNFYKLLSSPHFIFTLPFFSKVLNYFFLKNNVISFAFMSLIFGIKRNEIMSIYYSSGTFKCMTLNRFYKLGTIYGPLATEQRHIKQIQDYFPELQILIPAISFCRHGLFYSIQMNKFQSPDLHQVIDTASQILSRLRSYGYKQSCALAHFPYIKRGLQLVKVLFRHFEFEDKIYSMLALEWQVGPVHGDFHQKNIMSNTDGAPYIIDLDNFQPKGIQALDAITFCVDWIVNETTFSWQEAVEKIIALDTSLPVIAKLRHFFDNDVESLSILYILNRLGYENAHYGFLSRSVAKEFAIITRLIDQYPRSAI